MNESLSLESAKKEFKRFCDYYEVDADDMEPEQREAFAAIEKTILKGIRNESIEFKEDDNLGFCIVQKLKKGAVLTYREMNGEAKLAMSSKDENDVPAQCYALLGSLSGEGASVIKKLRGPDLTRAERIGAILLFC